MSDDFIDPTAPNSAADRSDRFVWKEGQIVWDDKEEYQEDGGDVPNSASEDEASQRFSDEDAPRNTLWVGLWLPQDVAEGLAIEDGEDPSDLHLTLCFLGDLDELPPDAPERARSAVDALSWRMPPAKVTLTGIARFSASEGSDGMDVLYATVDSRNISMLRNLLVDTLVAVGLPPRYDHEFVPHVTLAYIEPDADTDALVLPNVDVTFDTVTLSVGEEQTEFYLRGKPGAMEGVAPSMMYGELADLCSADGESRLFMEMEQYAEPPEWISILPKPGIYRHPKYGDIKITKERNGRFVTNYEGEVYQKHIPIDAEHETKVSGALGYLRGMRQLADGSVQANIEWTNRGTALLESDRFRYVSPEWYDEWEEPSSGKVHKDVLIGVALTTRPFFKDSALQPLVASEQGLFSGSDRYQHIQEDDVVVRDNDGDDDGTPQSFAELQQRFEQQNVELAAHRQARETADEALRQANERIAAIESGERRRRFSDMVMGRDGENDGRRWFGEIDKHVGMLESLTKAFGEDSDQFKTYVDQNRALAEQLATSEVLKEYGTARGGPVGDAPTDQFMAKVHELIAKESVSMSEAIEKVAAANPKLYAEHSSRVQVKV